MINIGIIEDAPVLRSNYREFFDADPAFNVVLCLSDIKRYEQLHAVAAPDILLLDLLLPSGNSLQSIYSIKRQFPHIKIVIISAVVDQSVTLSAIRRGADGYILKSSSLFYVKDALLNLGKSGIALSPLTANHLIFGPKNELACFEAFGSLTSRELELVTVLKSGMSNKMAAKALNVTFFTINQHLKSIYKKLNIHSKGQLIALAVGLPENKCFE